MGINASTLRGVFLSMVTCALGVVGAARGQCDQNSPADWNDLSRMTYKWLVEDYTPSSPCDVGDYDLNQRIDFVDFALLAERWDVKTYSIVYDPYKGVDWGRWERALAQHHDHMGRLSWSRIKAYDQVGYNVIVPLDYAGKRSAGSIYCTYRLWPVHDYLKAFNSDEQVLAALSNIKFFVPSMEEIGCYHMTSPFLTTYIELWEPDWDGERQPWHYDNSQGCINLINQYGGMAIIAHPVGIVRDYLELNNYRGIEIVNGLFYQKMLTEAGHSGSQDYIAHFREVWDYLLKLKSTTIWGFAVNDWYGPWVSGDDPWIDCGKIIVLLPAYDIDEYRKSLEQGCFFAVFDWARGRQNKYKYPRINQIIVEKHRISLDISSGSVAWIANGQAVADGNNIDLTQLPVTEGYRYIRAEVSNENGTVYTQPWTLGVPEYTQQAQPILP
jgi:hypothetical protein